MNKFSSTLLAVTFLTATAASQNLLSNPNFDSGGLAGWTAFGNASSEPANPPAATPRSAPNLAKLFGNFSGGFDVTGIFQRFPANPGDTFTIDCWSRHYSGDPLIGGGAPNDNWMVMKIAFFDAGGAEIGAAEGTILDGTSPTDVWIDNAAVSGTAPSGTTEVQALILFLQPGNDGGAGQVDDVLFTGPPPQNPTYPGSGNDLLIATGVNGASPTSGANVDVKQAMGGQLLEVSVSSPQGAYDMLQYFVLGQAFMTGSPPTPTLPGVWANFNQPIATLVGRFGGPVSGPVIPPGAATSSFFVTPTGMSGVSVMLQAVVFSSNSANGTFAISDGHEIQLQ